MHCLAELQALTAEQALAARAELEEVWTGVSGARLVEILRRHAARDGFTFLAAREDDLLTGFTYGYRGGPGEWWHDLVWAAMDDAERTHWLGPDHFEYVELHVRPDRQGRGLGGRLHDALLARQTSSRTAVLSTQVDNERALRLYDGRGWRVVVPQLDLGTGRPFAILGRDLP
jgi:ribosomal protein S18 acetylase RimI-like enzyme